MAGFPEGAPCWADVVLPDPEAGRRFYGELLDWEFREGGPPHGGYSQAFHEGANVAALAPLPEAGTQPMWNLYFAAADVDATARRVREHGGALLSGPTAVGGDGSVLLGRDPGGTVFGAWQAGSRAGFGRTGTPGAFVWAEVCTRRAEAVDRFYAAVFGLVVRQVGDGSAFDYTVWSARERPEHPVAGRMRMAPEPADAPPRLDVYFGVHDCDAAAATARRLGGSVVAEPADSPFGRLARLRDPQGAALTVIDTARAVGTPPG